MPEHAPIALILWGDPTTEYAEIDEVKLLLEATLFSGNLTDQAQKAPEIASLWINNPKPMAMAEELKDFLAKHDNLQVLYFSCHGSNSGLSFSQSGNERITCDDFCIVLSRALRSDDCLHVVFGSCEAMATQPHVEESMPDQVYAVSGFMSCPTPADVAGLVASIIQDDVALFEKLSSANTTVCSGGILPDQVEGVMRLWKSILDQHKAEPTREVLGEGGLAVVQATKDSNTNEWHRRTIPCI